MAKSTVIHTCVYGVSREQSSREGNPRFSFKTDDGIFKTVPNSGAAYGLENDFTVGVLMDLMVELTLDGRGNVVSWEREA